MAPFLLVHPLNQLEFGATFGGSRNLFEFGKSCSAVLSEVLKTCFKEMTLEITATTQRNHIFTLDSAEMIVKALHPKQIAPKRPSRTSLLHALVAKI